MSGANPVGPAGERAEPWAALSVPIDLSSLALVSSRLRTFAQESAGLAADSRALHDLRLATQEACTNVIKHGGGTTRDAMTVGLRLEGGVLTVRITSPGPGFDPTNPVARPPVAEGPAEGGYGLFLIRSLVDAVGFESSPQTNTLVLTKRVSAREEA
jgi:serine/threonine-protein kinase RsbW